MTGIDDNLYLRIDDSRLAANVTSDATSPTVTARYGNAACTNLLTGGGTSRCSVSFTSRTNSIRIVGQWSNSQNGYVISPIGISHCIAGGGRGHDTTLPKVILIDEV